MVPEVSIGSTWVVRLGPYHPLEIATVMEARYMLHGTLFMVQRRSRKPGEMGHQLVVYRHGLLLEIEDVE